MNIHVTFLTNAFLICLDFASRVLVPCPDYVHHILVVYAGMVDILIFLVFSTEICIALSTYLSMER